jgi:hypothetical protein
VGMDYALYVHLLRENIDTIKKNTATLTDDSKEVNLVVYENETNCARCMLIFHYQKAGQNHNINLTNRSLENMVKLIYFGMTTSCYFKTDVCTDIEKYITCIYIAICCECGQKGRL